MKYLPQNTLAFYQAAPQVHAHDLSEMPVSVFSAAVKEYRKACGKVLPDREAVTFYVLNHCASIVRKMFTPNETLPSWAQQVMQLYTAACAAQGKRMLYYIMSITTREMRHWASYGHMTPANWKAVEKVSSPMMVAFVKVLDHYDENEAVNKFMDEPPADNVGNYMRAMSAAFHREGKGWGGSFGGTKWGIVADCAVEFLTGKTTMEMMVDTGYTLAHNGGPIFNKGMMYDQYTGRFMTILDVQRSGQMPDLILDPTVTTIQKTDEAKEAVQLIATFLPNELKGWVDWVLVQKMCPDKGYGEAKYAKEIALQKKKHPVEAKPKVQKPKKKFINGKEVKVVGEWQVSPGETVQVFERVA